jgi:hypothetical protein
MKTWHRPEGGKGKVSWSGKVISIQPRICFTRSFDQRTHGVEFFLKALVLRLPLLSQISNENRR